MVCIQRITPSERTADLVAITAGLLAAALTAALLPATDPAGEVWDGLSPTTRRLAALGAGLLTALLAAAVASRWPALCSLLTPARRRAAAIASHARQCFDAQTPSQQGPETTPRLLVHAVLASRRITLLANSPAHETLGPEGLASLCLAITQHLAPPNTKPTEGLAQGIHAAADAFLALQKQ